MMGMDEPGRRGISGSGILCLRGVTPHCGALREVIAESQRNSVHDSDATISAFSVDR